MVDIGKMLSEWTGEAFKETTPDFLITTNSDPCLSGSGVEEKCLVQIENSELRSFVVDLIRK